MRIGIISDTHGSLTAFEKALDQLKDVELIIHAGDILYHGARNPLPEGYDTAALTEKLSNLEIPLMMVKGNVDAEVDDWVLPYPLPPYTLLQDDQLRIVTYHGFQHDYEDERASFAKKFGAQILIFGHIHKPIIKQVNGVTLINPGSLSLPKQSPAEPTFGIIDEDIVQIKRLEDGKVLLEKELNN